MAATQARSSCIGATKIDRATYTLSARGADFLRKLLDRIALLGANSDAGSHGFGDGWVRGKRIGDKAERR